MKYDIDVNGTTATIVNSEVGSFNSLSEIKQEVKRLSDQLVIEQIQVGGNGGDLFLSISDIKTKKQLDSQLQEWETLNQKKQQTKRRKKQAAKKKVKQEEYAELSSEALFKQWQENNPFGRYDAQLNGEELIITHAVEGEFASVKEIEAHRKRQEEQYEITGYRLGGEDQELIITLKGITDAKLKSTIKRYVESKIRPDIDYYTQEKNQFDKNVRAFEQARAKTYRFSKQACLKWLGSITLFMVVMASMPLAIMDNVIVSAYIEFMKQIFPVVKNVANNHHMDPIAPFYYSMLIPCLLVSLYIAWQSPLIYKAKFKFYETIYFKFALIFMALLVFCSFLYFIFMDGRGSPTIYGYNPWLWESSFSRFDFATKELLMTAWFPIYLLQGCRDGFWIAYKKPRLNQRSKNIHKAVLSD